MKIHHPTMLLTLLGMAVMCCMHADAVLPEQVRLALTAGATSDSAMTVVFATSNLTEPGFAVPIMHQLTLQC